MTDTPKQDTTAKTQTADAAVNPATLSESQKELVQMVERARAQQAQFQGLAPDVLIELLADKDEITHLKEYCISRGYIRMRHLNQKEKADLRLRVMITDSPTGQVPERRYSEADLAAMMVEVDHFFAGKDTLIDANMYIQQGYEPILESQNGVMVHLGYKELKAYKIPVHIAEARAAVARQESSNQLRHHQEEGRQSFHDAFDKQHAAAHGHDVAAVTA